MTRFSFMLFNVLLVVAIYMLLWLSGNAQERSIAYTLYYFSLPYIALLIIMAVLSTVRWFMKPDDDVIQSAVTYWHATWITGLLTFIALKLVSGALNPGIFKNVGHWFGH